MHDVPNSGNSVLWAFDYLVRAQQGRLRMGARHRRRRVPPARAALQWRIVDFIRQKEEEEEERASSAMVIDAFQFACELHSYLYFFIIFIP